MRKHYLKTFLKSLALTLLILSPFIFLAFYVYLYYILPIQLTGDIMDYISKMGNL